MLRIATRKSPLALKQTQIVTDKLKQHWPNLEIEWLPMSTQGDTLLDQKLLNFGGKSLFVKELELAILEDRADIAVHSIKDLPGQLPDGLELSCILKRDNPLDALLSLDYNRLQDLPRHAKIGTSSLRRQAQLLALRPDLKIISLRGNIQTRIEKLKQGDFSAIILACAGLERMQLEQLIREELQPEIMLPACGQGAIGIECRSDKPEIQELLKPLHDSHTAICVHTERKVNQGLGGHCHVPIAIFAELEQPDTIFLRATVLDALGQEKRHWQGRFHRTIAIEQAQKCAATLLEQGADKLMRPE